MLTKFSVPDIYQMYVLTQSIVTSRHLTFQRTWILHIPFQVHLTI